MPHRIIMMYDPLHSRTPHSAMLWCLASDGKPLNVELSDPVCNHNRGWEKPETRGCAWKMREAEMFYAHGQLFRWSFSSSRLAHRSPAWLLGFARAPAMISHLFFQTTFFSSISHFYCSVFQQFEGTRRTVRPTNR